MRRSLLLSLILPFLMISCDSTQIVPVDSVDGDIDAEKIIEQELDTADWISETSEGEESEIETDQEIEAWEEDRESFEIEKENELVEELGGPRPENVQIAAVSPRNIRIQWSPMDQDVEVVILRDDYSDGNFVEVARKPGPHGRFLDLALSPITSYQYKLTACGQDGCGDPVVTEEAITPPSDLPNLPVNVHTEKASNLVVFFGLAASTDGANSPSRFVAMRKDGTIVWEYYTPHDGTASEIELLSDHKIAVVKYLSMSLVDLDGTELFQNNERTAHHDIDQMADGRFTHLTFDSFDNPNQLDTVKKLLGDGIVILGQDHKTVEWSWMSKDHISTDDSNWWDMQSDFLGMGRDWTHSNAVIFDEAHGWVYLNVRNLNRFYKIAYPSGEVLWVMGDGGDFGQGLWSHAHDPHFTAPNKFMLFDNGRLRSGTTQLFSRAIEIEFDAEAKTASIVWEYRENPDFFADALGSAEPHDDGTVLITDGPNARLFEVTREKEKTWEMKIGTGWAIYKAVSAPESFLTEW